ncbi:MAG: translation elongation factor Ts [Coriobacteriales bacterium]|jgi:elongation factor Ts|nr:translation elongation factor Ts [Coriobacteriales bacterium]
MAEIKAQLVKELREMTGAGMMECKKALTEAQGEINRAVDVLRTRGLAAAAKKAGRVTNEGLIVCKVAPQPTSAAMIEINCETDFVARNDVFARLAEDIADAILVNAPGDLDALKELSVGSQTVGELLTAGIHTLGENIQVSRFVRLTAEEGSIASYVHGGGRLGILAQLDFNEPKTGQNKQFIQLARDIAMQIAATNPLEVSRDSIAAEVIQRELDIYRAQAAESGKSADVQEKMVQGRLEKFYKENTLLEQPFIKDTAISVRQYLKNTAKILGDQISVVGFRRYEIGGQ